MKKLCLATIFILSSTIFTPIAAKAARPILIGFVNIDDVNKMCKSKVGDRAYASSITISQYMATCTFPRRFDIKDSVNSEIIFGLDAVCKFKFGNHSWFDSKEQGCVAES
jgi:hypothetical protein